MNDWFLGHGSALLRLYWTTWANDMKFVMNHAPGAVTSNNVPYVIDFRKEITMTKCKIIDITPCSLIHIISYKTVR